MTARTTSGAVLLAAAVTALVSGGAMAQVHPEKPTYKYEKCYGVARAGHNDCFFASNSCAGTSIQDDDARAWIYVPRGTCTKISRGTLEAPKST